MRYTKEEANEAVATIFNIAKVLLVFVVEAAMLMFTVATLVKFLIHTLQKAS